MKLPWTQQQETSISKPSLPPWTRHVTFLSFRFSTEKWNDSTDQTGMLWGSNTMNGPACSQYMAVGLIHGHWIRVSILFRGFPIIKNFFQQVVIQNGPWTRPVLPGGRKQWRRWSLPLFSWSLQTREEHRLVRGSYNQVLWREKTLLRLILCSLQIGSCAAFIICEPRKWKCWAGCTAQQTRFWAWGNGGCPLWPNLGMVEWPRLTHLSSCCKIFFSHEIFLCSEDHRLASALDLSFHKNN